MVSKALLLQQLQLELLGWTKASVRTTLRSKRIEARKAAKTAKDLAAAGGIRNELKAQGIELIDKPGGLTEWLRS